MIKTERCAYLFSRSGGVALAENPQQGPIRGRVLDHFLADPEERQPPQLFHNQKDVIYDDSQAWDDSGAG